MSCRRCIVSGRVQGVFYRATVQREARSLGISGYAKNLPDGRVEVLACGGEPELREFDRVLREGPPAARVMVVECEPDPGPAPSDFVTR